jgi:uncharacterized metal-binding protein YceD (DUF177 family)
MGLLLNLRQLKTDPVHLDGELSPQELEIESVDELIRVPLPLKYHLDAQLFDDSILVEGYLRVGLSCECVRCLKKFDQTLSLESWACHIPLEGEDRAAVVNDAVDLTPYVREDILLLFPQHPLCEPGCSGLPNGLPGGLSGTPAPGQTRESPSAWAELNKLKLD